MKKYLLITFIGIAALILFNGIASAVNLNVANDEEICHFLLFPRDYPEASVVPIVEDVVYDGFWDPNEGQLTLTFTLSGTAVVITHIIQDNERIAHACYRHLSPGTHTVTWDGMTYDGAVKDGEYILRLTTVVDDGTDDGGERVFNAVFYVSYETPETPETPETSLTLDHEITCDTCTLNSDDPAIRYMSNVNKNNVKVEIIKPNFELVKTLADNKSLSSDVWYTDTWDYKNVFGNYAADGSYIYRILSYNSSTQMHDILGQGTFSIVTGQDAPSTDTPDTSDSIYYDSSGNCTGYTDLDEHCDAAYYLAQNGIMTGAGPGVFDPDSHLQRDQMAKVILKTFDLFEESTDYCQGVNPFPDVTADDWSYQYVCRAKQLGIITGYKAGVNAGLYKPGNVLTEAEFYTMLLRRVDLSEDLGSSNYYKGGEWYAEYLNYALLYDLIDYNEAGGALYDKPMRIEAGVAIYDLSLLDKI